MNRLLAHATAPDASLEDIGDMHQATDSFAAAMHYYRRGLALERRRSPRLVTARLLRKVGDCLRARGRIRRGLVYLDHALEMLLGLERTGGGPGAAPSAERNMQRTDAGAGSVGIEIGVVLRVRSQAMCNLGNFREGAAAARAALRRLQPTLAHSEYGFALLMAGVSAGRQGDARRFERYARDALAAFRRVDDRHGIATAYNTLGIVYKNACRWSEAVRSFERCITLSEELGLSRRLVRAHGNLGILLMKTGDLKAALRHLEQALSMARQGSDLCAEPQLLSSYGCALVRAGRWTAAERILQQAADIARARGYQRSQAFAQLYLGDAAMARDRVAVALRHYRAALRIARSIGPRSDLVVESARRLASAELRAGQHRRAFKRARQALRLADICAEVHEVGFLRRILARASRFCGRAQEAHRYYREAIQAFDAVALGEQARDTRLEVAAVWIDSTTRSDWVGALKELLIAFDATPTAQVEHRKRAAQLLSQVREQLVHGSSPARQAPQVATLIEALHPALQRFRTVDPALLRVLALAQQAAQAQCIVMISGETGTGKGLLAQCIHDISGRSQHRFVSINCASLPEGLLESELFGVRKGAYTGADRDRVGLLEAASGGTVFLDEISKTSLAFQGKLLQFLDSHEVRPVGSNQLRRVDVRILAASKVDLPQCVERGTFLEDLYFRLNEFPVTVPPLRNRPEDILLLAETFVERFMRDNGKRLRGIKQAAQRALVRYLWPGNVRELEKCVKRAVILCPNHRAIGVDHLLDAVAAAGTSGSSGELETELVTVDLKAAVADYEARIIQEAMRECENNKSAVARRLGISYPTLLHKLKRMTRTE